MGKRERMGGWEGKREGREGEEGREGKGEDGRVVCSL